VSLDEEETLDDVRETLHHACEELATEASGRDVIVRLVLTGRTQLHSQLARPGAVDDVLADLRDACAGRDPFVWVDRLSLDTQGQIDRDARRQGHDFVGELIRQAEALAQDEVELAGLRPLLAPLFENSRAPSQLKQFTDEQLREWLARAEARCLDLLVQEATA